jgi:hypothetical protein
VRYRLADHVTASTATLDSTLCFQPSQRVVLTGRYLEWSRDGSYITSTLLRMCRMWRLPPLPSERQRRPIIPLKHARSGSD